MAFVLHVPNVQPDSIETLQLPRSRSLHLQFASMGSGYYPTHYAILVQLPSEADDKLYIDHVEADASDENVVLKLYMSKGCETMPTSYLAGPDSNDLKEYTLGQYNDDKNEAKNSDDDESEKSLQVNMEHHEVEQALQVTIAPQSSIDEDETEQQADQHQQQQQHHKKPNKKQRKRNKRSLSESACEDIKAEQLQQQVEQQQHKKKEQDQPKVSTPTIMESGTQPMATLKLPQRKQRSFSECHESSSVQRGILKRFSRYGPRPSMSDSCSSIDDYSSSYSCSVDAAGAGFSQSFGGIPEERGGGDEAGLSESCKKTVTFNDHIMKQVFRWV